MCASKQSDFIKCKGCELVGQCHRSTCPVGVTGCTLL